VMRQCLQRDEWMKTVGGHWKPIDSTVQVEEQDLTSSDLFALKFHEFDPKKTPFSGDFSSLRNAMRRVPSITSLYDICAVRNTVRGSINYLILNSKWRRDVGKTETTE